MPAENGGGLTLDDNVSDCGGAARGVSVCGSEAVAPNFPSGGHDRAVTRGGRMISPGSARRFLLLALAMSLVPGCARHLSHVLAPRDALKLELRSARVPTLDAQSHVRRMSWSANSPGDVDHFVYAVNPRNVDRVDDAWRVTRETQSLLAFRSADPASAEGGALARNPQIFAVRAVGPDGALSAPVSQAFFGENIAPTVTITSPVPSRLLFPVLPPAFAIHWAGIDPDGFSGRPVKYKYRLIRDNDFYFSIDVAIANPDSLRRFAAPTFAEWDSTSGDTLTMAFTNLLVNERYLFVVTAIDDHGDYDPVFSLDKNMLCFTVAPASVLGPRFTIFNELFNYSYPSGGMNLTPALTTNAPADQPITFRWFATGLGTAEPVRYRWAADILDLFDATPRSGPSDWAHWSEWSEATTSATVGPYLPPGFKRQPHLFYVEAQDEFGSVSLAVIRYVVSRPSFDNNLLIVDDTRLEPDKFNGTGARLPYGSAWPSAAELDTFLYARGGVPWRAYPVGTLSSPGLFANYAFDTLGTRIGRDDLTISPVTLGQYRHVIWMTDPNGALNLAPGSSLVLPMGSLRYMSRPGANSLATYCSQGGQLWILGGAAAYATLIDWNARGSRANDNGFGTVFNVGAGELVPGRFMYDFTHWRSELISTVGLANVVRSDRAVGGWPGAPDYSQLPVALSNKSSATDPIPPGRNAGNFYVNVHAFEYISDVSIDPEAALDTLYKLTGSNIKITGLPGEAGQSPCMTYYHGADNGSVVFSGFDLWGFRRSQLQSITDFVLQNVWHLTPGPGGAGQPQIADESLLPEVKLPVREPRATPSTHARLVTRR